MILNNLRLTRAQYPQYPRLLTRFLIPIGSRAPVHGLTLSCTFSSTSKALRRPTKKWMAADTEDSMFETDGVRVAIEGCGHGTLDAIYASVGRSAQARGWNGVDLLIIGGDFQAARNAADLSVMSVPLKYREMGDFYKYYNGEEKAPYLTIFIAGNHEASAHLWELYYGGWVAPNMYYLGAANVLRFGPLRIAGMSGIWKHFDYRKPHHERLPFSKDDIKSFYHVREIDVRKLLLIKEPVDVGLSHDWPRGIEFHGNKHALWTMKPDFREESIDGKLGNPAAEYVMDRLRPAYWFSAHLHCKFSAIKTYPPPETESTKNEAGVTTGASALPSEPEQVAANPDEIDLDSEEDADAEASEAGASAPSTDKTEPTKTLESLRAQLPASFAAPKSKQNTTHKNPGQPVPPTITNTMTRFLALDKCLPGRKFIQLCALHPLDPELMTKYPPKPLPSSLSSDPSAHQRYTLSYDPEWLAIQRTFHASLTLSPNCDAGSPTPHHKGEATYARQIAEERAWVDEHIVRADKLSVPKNFVQTAPPHFDDMPGYVMEQPEEYTNPQTAAFCELLGVENLWDATPEERAERRAAGPPPVRERERAGGGGGGGRGGGRGGGNRGWGGGGGGRGRGGRGGRGGGGGSRGGRGRGRGFGGRH